MFVIVDLFAFTVFLSTVFFLFSLVRKHAGVLASVDVTSLPEERDAHVRERLLRDRMRRKASSLFRLVRFLCEPLARLFRRTRSSLQRLYHWLLTVREKHRKDSVVGGASLSHTKEKEEPQHSSLQDEMACAESCMEEEDFEKGEKIYVQLIARETKYLPAYNGLAYLYMKKRDFEAACEVLAYAVKLQDEFLQDASEAFRLEHSLAYANTYHDASQLYQKLERFESALDMCKKALALEEKNPKFLNELIEIHLHLKQRFKAEQALELLRKVNEDNQGIEQLEKRCAALHY